MDAHAEVVKLLDQLRDRAKVFSPRAQEEFNSVTDSIETLTRAYMAPEIPDWSQYGLTKYETRLAECLHAKYGRPVSRDTIMDALYYDRAGEYPERKVIDVFVFRVRKHLEEFGAPFQIETALGIGLKMVDASSAFIRKGHSPMPYGALHKARALQALKAA